MSFTYSDAKTAAYKAGFAGTDAGIAAAVAMAESGGNASAVGGPNSNGTSDFGAWQINSVHKEILTRGNKFNLDDNARMAHEVFVKQGWKAWSTYRDGKYLKFVDTKTGSDTLGIPPAAAASISADGPAKIDVGSSITGAINAFNKQIAKIGSDIAVVVIAVVLLALGVVILGRNTDAANIVKTVAKVGAKL